MKYEGINGIPKFEVTELSEKKSKYCVCIPIINEGDKIKKELIRAQKAGIDKIVDILICDGGSVDGCTDLRILEELGVNALLVKKDIGRQGAQLRMGLWWSLQRGYDGFITIDGNNKDSIEDIPNFIEKLKKGYDFIQGSRFIKGGLAENTPFVRLLSVKLIHAPIISITARHRFTDTTNAYRGYSRQYLEDARVNICRDIFLNYELLAYLSTRATQLGYKVCEIPVKRVYPKKGKVPTKISFFKGNMDLLTTLMKNAFGKYNP